MNLLLEALNRPKDAYERKSSPLSWVLVAVTILIVTVFDPCLSYFVRSADQRMPIDLVKALLLSGAGIVTYLVMCTAFWLICKAFKSPTPLRAYIRAWGISYIPTMLCAVVVSVTETFFYIFWNNSIWGMLLSIVFVGILVWKTILYVIFLRTVAGLRGGRLIGAFAACAPVILLLACVNGAIGLKTPIL